MTVDSSPASMQSSTAVPVDEATYASVRNFLFDEAALLDSRRYTDWFALLTPDIQYRVAAHATRFIGTEPKEVLILDDRATDIELRIRQISSPNLTYTENPAPLMRRFVSNIQVRTEFAPDEFAVESYLLMCRNGGTLGEAFTYSLVRRDTLRRADGGLRLASRHALLDQTVMASPNIATFV